MNDKHAAAELPRQNSSKTRVRGRPFACGNPGRPTGSRNRASLLLDQIADSEADDVLAAVVSAAKSGDMRAAEIILGRVWPTRKSRPVKIALPTVKTPADLSAAIGVVAEAVGIGDITPDEGQAVAAVLELQRRAIETAELADRVAALEQAASR